jgi:pimeloyl-ACP methyl ester carboxylesterase
MGNGKPVVFLHGFASYLNIWISPSELMKDKFSCILVDLPGFGLSDRKKDDYSPSRVADIVYNALRKAGYEKISIVGHSWGGAVALALALKYPDFVERIAVVDGWIYPEQRYSFFEWAKKPLIGEILFGMFYSEQMEYRYMMGFYNPHKWLDYTLVTSLKKVFDLPGTEAASLAVTRGLDEIRELSKKYHKIRQKTLIIWCEEDPVADIFFARRLNNEIMDSELLILTQCGHFPMIEQTGKFASIIMTFFNTD